MSSSRWPLDNRRRIKGDADLCAIQRCCSGRLTSFHRFTLRLLKGIRANDMGDKPRQGYPEPSPFLARRGLSETGRTSQPNLAVPRGRGETEKRQNHPKIGWDKMASRLSSDARIEAKNPLAEFREKGEQRPDTLDPSPAEAEPEAFRPVSTVVNNGVDLRSPARLAFKAYWHSGDAPTPIGGQHGKPGHRPFK